MRLAWVCSGWLVRNDRCIKFDRFWRGCVRLAWVGSVGLHLGYVGSQILTGLSWDWLTMLIDIGFVEVVLVCINAKYILHGLE